MPKLAQNRNQFNPRVIEDKVVIQMIAQRTDKHIVASKMDMPIRTFNHKLATGYWTYEELMNLFRILNMPNEYILMIFGR